jgi:predicted P-loop ATPase
MASFPFAMSFIVDKFAKIITTKTVSLEDLADICANTVSPSKDAQPFWKMGLYGSNRLASGCLRYDRNFEEATGIEVDCDGGMSFDEVKARLDPYGLAFMLHTTARHTATDPRWRGLFPFSKSRPPSERARMVSRINGILGAVLTKESWALSTAFKYGSILGRPACEVFVSDGEEFVDERDDFDATAMPFHPPAGQGGKGGKLDFESMDEAELLDVIHSGEHGWRPAKFLIDLWESQDVPESDAIANLEVEWDAIPTANRRPKWAQQRANIPRWVKQGYSRAARRKGKFFSALVDHFENVWKGAIRFNAFTQSVEVCDPFPPLPQPGQVVGDYRPFRDPQDTLETLIAVQGGGFPAARKSSVFDAVFLAATRHPCHPVQQYLNGLVWDHKERLNRLFTDYIPCTVPNRDDDPDRHGRVVVYLEAIGPCFMIGAVARVYRPGCKVDTLPLLESPQGYNKSKALAAFVPNPVWFSDDIPPGIGDKDSKQALAGKWIIELSEFPQLRREAEHLKAFFSRSTDRYRPPYARLPADWPRQNVFVATINSLELSDVTGNRRFWPVLLDAPINDKDIERDRDQLWAEAVHLYREGWQWWLAAEVEEIARQIQDEYVEGDVIDESILDWIDLAFPAKDRGLVLSTEDRKIRFTVRQIVEHALGFAIDNKDNVEGRRVATAADEKRVIRRLKKLKFRPDPHRSRTDGRMRYWVQAKG